MSGHRRAEVATDCTRNPTRVPDGYGLVQAELDGFGMDGLGRRLRVALNETVQRMKRHGRQAIGEERRQRQQYQIVEEPAGKEADHAEWPRPRRIETGYRQQRGPAGWCGAGQAQPGGQILAIGLIDTSEFRLAG